MLDCIRRMVIHGLYKTALTNGYGAEVFRAFKAEQVRLFDNLEENVKRLQAAEMWSESKRQDYQSEQKDTKRKSWEETGTKGE